MIHPRRWQVLVVGGGHAGTEAALAAVRMGCEVLLVTASVDRIGWLSCNPSVGGVGKTHLVAEVDAMGGEIALAADRAGVHYKLLHETRGPAVQALRAQCDKLEYATALREKLERRRGCRSCKQPSRRSGSTETCCAGCRRPMASGTRATPSC